MSDAGATRGPLARLAPGLLVVTALSVAAFALAQVPALRASGLSALTLAIVVGALLGNLAPGRVVTPAAAPGLRFAQKTLLRVGVALYGLNLSLAQIQQVGVSAVLVDAFIVISTVVVGWWVGHRWLRMDRETVVLASAGSAICGAAAVMATESVLNSASHKTSAAVGQVVLFGTLAMLLYPLLAVLLPFDAMTFGLYVGSTVHEVAQVVAVGKTVGGATAETAVVVKMIRVMMLAPFLLVIGRLFAAPGARAATASVPVFAVAFIAIALVHPLLGLPPAVLAALRSVDIMLLAAAMAALGLDTTVRKLRQAGSDALVLGAILFAYLVIAGGLVNGWAATLRGH